MGDHRLFANFSTEELQEELERRKKPCPVLNPDWASVLAYTQAALTQVACGNGLPKDFEHYLMETVLEAVYGKGIFPWWNGKLDSK